MGTRRQASTKHTDLGRLGRPSIAELARRVDEVEDEIRRLKTLIVGSISPPTTEFEKTIDLSLEESEPFFKEITRIMREEITSTNTDGIAVLAGLYENEKTGQRAWFASRQSIETLLSHKDTAYKEASALARALSSPIRLRILVGLCYGPRRFRELVAVTSVRGGQLTHHLEALLTQGLIHRGEDKYFLTTKGWEALLALLLAAQTKSGTNNTRAM